MGVILHMSAAGGENSCINYNVCKDGQKKPQAKPRLNKTADLHALALPKESVLNLIYVWEYE